MKEKIVMLIYNLLLLILSFLILPLFFVNQIRHKKNPLVHFGKGLKISKEPGKPIWIHAVSVGEVHLLKPLVELLLKKGNRIVISTVTETGNGAARRLFGDSVDIIYFPIDYFWVVKSYINRINPKLVLLVETEIWPNFLYQIHSKNIPVVLINGRISIRSSLWYKRFSFFFKPLINKFNLICVQNEEEKKHFSEYADSSKIYVTGNIKYSNIMKSKCKIAKPENTIVLIAGSTHENEEEMIFSVYKKISRKKDVFLIVAPRHIERVEDVAKLAKRFDISTGFLSCFRSYDFDALIVDTIGDLSSLYGIADIAFIGGSMIKRGGHNPLEACLYSIPVVTGSYYFNFNEIVGELKDNKAIMIAENEADLADKIVDLITDEIRRKEMGRAGFEVLRGHLDNLGKTINLIADYL